MLSIITINYNNKEGLERTIKSVCSQSYEKFEYIIIDGASNDGSLDVINSYKKDIDYFVSEKDHGVYNAMNKGIKKSKGDYLLFLNSGDTLINKDVLAVVGKQINSKVGLYYGNINLVYKDSERLKIYPDELTFNFFYESSLPHPATFIQRKLFDTVFYYNEDYRIVSDWEFFICAICKYEVSYCYLDKVISNYDMSGISSSEENKSLIEQEKNSVYETHFKWFYEDYLALKSFKRTFLNKRSKALLELEKYKITKSINSISLFSLGIALRIIRKLK